MPAIRHPILTAAVFTACAPLATGDLTVEVPEVAISEGAVSVTLPITVAGADPVTDMNAIVQIADGGPLAGAPAAPQVSAVDFSSSIWPTTPGGFVSFFASSAPSSAIVDPSVSLLKGGESVTASGTLMSLTVDTATFPPGDYPVSLSATTAGDSELFNNGTTVPTTFLTGSISILRALDHWRLKNFQSAIENPLLEATFWGDDADPDLDGIVNLLEFVYGTDPITPGHGNASPTKPGVPSSTVIEVNGSRFLEIAYSRRIVATGLTLQVSSSSDQIDWQSPAPGLSQVGIPVQIDDLLYEFVRLRLPIPENSPPQFIRISATHLP